MAVENFDAKAFAQAYAELGNYEKALKEIGVHPTNESTDIDKWYERTAYRYKQRADVQEALVEIYSKKAAMEYADCLPLSATAVKNFLKLDSDKPNVMKAQAELGAKILQDANIALGGSQFKQPVITNRDELLDQLAATILGDKGLVEQIVGRAATVIDGEAARDVSPASDERSTVLQTLPEAD